MPSAAARNIVEAIRADLAWLGLDARRRGAPVGSGLRSLRSAHSSGCAQAGRVYPCYETAQELDLKRKVLLGRGLPPVYDRAALALSEAEHRREGSGGRRAALALQARP